MTGEMTGEWMLNSGTTRIFAEIIIGPPPTPITTPPRHPALRAAAGEPCLPAPRRPGKAREGKR